MFSVLNASDRSSMQWPAAMLFGFLLFTAVVLTLVHWLVIVPILWAKTHNVESQQES